MAFHASVRLYAALALGTVSATPVALHAVAIQAAVKASIDDTWQGTLHADKDLRIVVKIAKGADGKLSSQFYSIDQGGRPVPVTSTTLREGDVALNVDAIGGVYAGKLSPDGNVITGTWTQGEKPLPLILTRATKETAWAIPEPPKPVPAMDPKADPTWDVVSIKLAPPEQRGKGFGGPPRQFRTGNTTINDLISYAYKLNPKQMEGGPAWMESEKYNLTTGAPDVPGAPNEAQLQSMMKKLLAERFGLKFHLVQKEMSAYVITVAKTGPKLTVSTADPTAGSGFTFPGKLGTLVFRNISMDGFATWMQNGVFDRPCVNHTGLQGKFDGTLKWTPDETQFQIFGVKIVPDESADAPPPITTAMEQQLGLHLSAEKTAVDVMVIDHVEKPSEN